MSKVVFAQIHRESVDWLGPAPGLGAELDPLVKTNIIVNWKLFHRLHALLTQHSLHISSGENGYTQVDKAHTAPSIESAPHLEPAYITMIVVPPTERLPPVPCPQLRSPRPDGVNSPKFQTCVHRASKSLFDSNWFIIVALSHKNDVSPK